MIIGGSTCHCRINQKYMTVMSRLCIIMNRFIKLVMSDTITYAIDNLAVFGHRA